MEKITFTVTLGDANLIMSGLRELPHRVSHELIQNLVQQNQNQPTEQRPRNQPLKSS